MTDNLRFALTTLEKGSYTLVLWDGERLVTSCDRGVSPLVDLYERKEDYTAFSAADKVVGKAAAFMYILLGVREIWTHVISEGALELFEKHEVFVTYKEVVPFIINRTKTGMCPMENAVFEIDDPTCAHKAILQKLEELNSKKTTSP